MTVPGVIDRRPETPPFILFDLDGTLVDSADGIVASFEATLRDFGRSADRALLGTLIGPPLNDSFVRLGFSTGQLDEAISRYRAHYGVDGVTRCRLYDGVIQLLDTTLGFDVPLSIATAKRIDFAERILDDLEIGKYFRAVAGAPLDGRLTTKTVIVSEALTKLSSDASGGWMVGDRRFDVVAARSLRLVGIGVQWGYGTAEELRRAGATWLVERPADLSGLIVDSFSGGPLSRRP